MLEKISKNVTKMIQFNDDETSAGIEGWYCENFKTDSIYIYFYGTNNDNDWWDNFAALPHKMKNKKYSSHWGWQDEYYGIAERLIKMTKPFKRVVIGGHSAGTFPALNLLADLKESFPEKTYRVRIFGGVRNFSWFSAPKFNDMNVIRYYNPWDFIRLFPMIFLGFRHTKLRKFFKSATPRKYKNIFAKLYGEHQPKAYNNAIDQDPRF
jgi:predicted lipase